MILTLTAFLLVIYVAPSDTSALPQSTPGSLTPHGDAPERGKRRINPGSAPEREKARAPVPFRVFIRPESSPNTVVQCAVGGVTKLVFEDEDPVNLVSGLREQLGVSESDEKAAERLMYLRPTMALAGVTTNVIIETNKGRASFFIKTVFIKRGPGPGDFHGEVRIRTAGANARRKRLEAELTELTEQVRTLERTVEEAQAAGRRAEQAAARAEEVGLNKGRGAALAGLADGMIQLRKGCAVITNHCRIQQIARLMTLDAVWAVYEIRNLGKQSVHIEDVSIARGRAEMYAPARELLPGGRVRVAIYVAGAPAGEQLVFNLSGTSARAALTN